MAFGRFVECRSNHFRIDTAGHVGYFFRTFVNQQHDHIYFRMVGSDGIGDFFHQDGFTGLGLSHDQGTLSFTDW